MPMDCLQLVFTVIMLKMNKDKLLKARDGMENKKPSV